MIVIIEPRNASFFRAFAEASGEARWPLLPENELGASSVSSWGQHIILSAGSPQILLLTLLMIALFWDKLIVDWAIFNRCTTEGQRLIGKQTSRSRTQTLALDSMNSEAK